MGTFSVYIGTFVLGHKFVAWDSAAAGGTSLGRFGTSVAGHLPEIGTPLWDVCFGLGRARIVPISVWDVAPSPGLGPFCSGTLTTLGLSTVAGPGLRLSGLLRSALGRSGVAADWDTSRILGTLACHRARVEYVGTFPYGFGTVWGCGRTLGRADTGLDSFEASHGARVEFVGTVG